MSAERQLPGINLNFLGLVSTTVNDGATTVAVTAVATGGILTVARDGKKATLSTGNKAYAQYDGNGDIDATTRTLVATSTTGQAAIVVHGLRNVAGTETLVQVVGPVVDLDAASSITTSGGLQFPNIGDLIVPVGYTVVVNPAASSTATFTFGTTNWDATSIVNSNEHDIAALPRRPLARVA